ncbi:FAD-dependent oxidoreductase, partial [Bradyrhizobium liaoningense]|uniref:FAD-dependent oxidoreductase n=1 Tax=Bradyrhizobium liaoningense TaxID=43992 RepID=UPI002011C3C7
MSEQADILVIGLGAMGSAALYQLAKRGVKAVGLDRSPRVTSNSSGCGQSNSSTREAGQGTV